jgi:hypothetical protein
MNAFSKSSCVVVLVSVQVNLEFGDSRAADWQLTSPVMLMFVRRTLPVLRTSTPFEQVTTSAAGQQEHTRGMFSVQLLYKRRHAITSLHARMHRDLYTALYGLFSTWAAAAHNGVKTGLLAGN